ncbi:Uu.00g022560.m01.CDS01 [Anthostomella pinea]|uniref:Uu.00g022560.m01.CDS01 n=1 Tax=Anthostomella pinea TaxID=933095 RepID=A0AAI8VZY6_9PEZI|nr:Uu.00g022560.m01.CDS01 [Anthostomella pinea]
MQDAKPGPAALQPTKAFTVKVRRSRHDRPNPDNEDSDEEVNLQVPDPNIPLDLLDKPLQEWTDPAMMFLPAQDGDDAATSLPPSYENHTAPAHRLFTVWPNLDEYGKTVVLKELTDHLKSFQLACNLLELQPSEVESFLRKYVEDRHHAQQWRQGLNTNQSPLVRIRAVSVALAREFLAFMGLGDYMDAVGSWENCNIAWPPEIDITDSDERGLGHSRIQFPVQDPILAGASEAIPRFQAYNATLRKPEDERGVVAFRAPQPGQGEADASTGIRIHYFMLPAGSVVFGPNGRKTLIHGGKYRLMYPNMPDEPQGLDTSELLIAKNFIQEPPVSCQYDWQQPLPYHVNRSNRSSMIANQPESSFFNNAFGALHPQTSFFDDAFEASHPQTTLRQVEIDNLWLPRGGTSLNGMPFSQRGAKFESPPSQGRSVHFERAMNKVRALEIEHQSNQTPDYRLARASEAQPTLAKAMRQGLELRVYPDLARELEQFDAPGFAEQRITEALSQSLTTDDPKSKTDRLIEKGNQRDVQDYSHGAKQHVPFHSVYNDQPPDEATADPRDIFPNPYELEELREPATAPFHQDGEPRGPLELGPVKQLVDLKLNAHGALYQFRFPRGYLVESPSGYIMNFDTDHMEPADGPSQPGMGGQYTFVPPRILVEAPDFKWYPMDDFTMLRMFVGEDMVILRDGVVLPHFMDFGFHQLSRGHDGIDVYGENGRYHVFGLPPGLQPAGQGDDPDAMEVDEEEDMEDSEESPQHEALGIMARHQAYLDRLEHEEKEEDRKAKRRAGNLRGTNGRYSQPGTNQASGALQKAPKKAVDGATAQAHKEDSPAIRSRRARPIKNTTHDKHLGLVEYNPEDLKNDSDSDEEPFIDIPARKQKTPTPRKRRAKPKPNGPDGDIPASLQGQAQHGRPSLPLPMFDAIATREAYQANPKASKASANSRKRQPTSSTAVAQPADLNINVSSLQLDGAADETKPKRMYTRQSKAQSQQEAENTSRSPARPRNTPGKATSAVKAASPDVQNLNRFILSQQADVSNAFAAGLSASQGAADAAGTAGQDLPSAAQQPGDEFIKYGDTDPETDAE